VIWAVNRPLRPRKPMMSVDPAVRLRINGSVRITGSVSADPGPDHVLEVRDLIKTVFSS
jgi:hypothetical protein